MNVFMSVQTANNREITWITLYIIFRQLQKFYFLLPLSGYIVVGVYKQLTVRSSVLCTSNVLAVGMYLQIYRFSRRYYTYELRHP